MPSIPLENTEKRVKKPAQNMNFVRATVIAYLITDSMLLNLD